MTSCFTTNNPKNSYYIQGRIIIIVSSRGKWANNLLKVLEKVDKNEIGQVKIVKESDKKAIKCGKRIAREASKKKLNKKASKVLKT